MIINFPVFLFLPCCFWINLEKLDDTKGKRVLRSLLFFAVFLLFAAGGFLLRFIHILQENWDFGKKAGDILKFWEKDPSFSFVPLSCPGTLFTVIVWGTCFLLLPAACTGIYLSLQKYRRSHLFFYILPPLLAFPVFFFTFHIHREKENTAFFNFHMQQTQKILHDSEKSREEKSDFVRSVRENFPVTYEKPLWKNIKSFPESFRKGL